MTVKLNAKFVKHILTDRDMSARELASLAGIGEATMYRLLNGAPFNSETLGKLAEALGCHPVDLIEAEGYGSPHRGVSPQRRATWLDLAGAGKQYAPLLGEDAQAWVSRTRAESDTSRLKALRRGTPPEAARADR